MLARRQFFVLVGTGIRNNPQLHPQYRDMGVSCKKRKWAGLNSNCIAHVHVVLMLKTHKREIESLELLFIRLPESEQSDEETLADTKDCPNTSDSESTEMEFKGKPQVMSKKNWLNIALLGFGFMLLFTAFQTTAFTQVSSHCIYNKYKHCTMCLCRPSP